MPRKARRESSTGVYHVIMRGNNRNWIFFKSKYKDLMKKLIFKQVELQLIEVYAWCIMDNHVHMVIKAEKQNMIEALFNINGTFAKKYNKSEKTVGHVFENRYKSECVEDDVYFKRVIRYVHNNPVHSKIVTTPESYRWSSYDSYIKGDYMKNVVNIFEEYFKSKEEFILYHQLEDDEEYLEIREDIRAFRENKALKIIDKYCNSYKVSNTFPEHLNSNLKRTMIKEMLKESKLSYRRIAEIVGMSVSGVYKISKL